MLTTGHHTSATDVTDRFTRSPKAGRALAAWTSDARRQLVVPLVLAHTTDVVDRLETSDITVLAQAIASGTAEHALGEVKASAANAARTVADWSPSFAFTHLLHFITEDAGRQPTFGEVRQHPLCRELLWREAAEVQRTSMLSDCVDAKTARDAVRWRVGNAYYSFIREQYVVAVLRSHGYGVHQHPLADALFRVDCWVGDTNIDLYVRNPFYRGSGQGRKVPSSARLDDARASFENVVLELPVTRVFGVVHLPVEAEVLRAAEVLPS